MIKYCRRLKENKAIKRLIRIIKLIIKLIIIIIKIIIIN
jgi:hypothetical protein